jgi:hypothetical protein
MRASQSRQQRTYCFWRFDCGVSARIAPSTAQLGVELGWQND